ncbi:MAG: hypothetical protein Q4G35_07740 [Propionibacteriaceae bacterium]|nr:hypothetical protein [Propionibacteriaceae bacterium]
MVPPLRRLRGIVPRTVPLLIALMFIATGLTIADAAVSDETVDLFELISRPVVLTTLIIAGVVALLGIPASIGYARAQNKLSARVQLWVGLGIIVFWLFGLSLIARLAQATQGLHMSVELRIGFLVLAALAGYYGAGSILGWAGRRSAREMTSTIPAIARILPLLILTVLLVFFTTELWALSAVMSKARMWMLSGFLSLMIVLIVLPTSFDLLDEVKDDDDCEPLLENTPFAGLRPHDSQLSSGERFNLVAVTAAVQFIQIAIFAVATFTVFALFGSLTLTNDLIAKWTGVPSEPLVILGVALPLEAHMFRVCVILALFSGISFAASMLQDSMYRSLFLDRVADEVRLNLAARNRYRATLTTEGQAPARWSALVDVD